VVPSTPDPIALGEQELRDGWRVFDALRTPVWVFDADERRLVWANHAALRLFGASSLQELLALDFAAEKTRPWDPDAPGSAMATSTFSRLPSTDGRNLLLIEATSAGAQAELERRLKDRALELERLNEALGEERKFMSLVLETVGSLLVVTNARGEIVKVNRALCELLGSTAEDLRDRHIWDFLVGHEAEVVRRTFVEHGESLHVVMPKAIDGQVRARSGELRLITWQNALIFDREGRTEFAIGAGTDITGRREMQGRLQISDRMASIGTLAAGVAHGINNPLAYVIANLHHIRERIDAELDPATLSELKELLDESLDGANRVRRIVGDLRTFSREDDDRVQAVDLHQVVERALNMAMNELRHRARVIPKFGAIPRVLGTEGKLGQVVLNLLVNAAQAIEPGAVDENTIELDTALDRHGRPTLEIRDTGVGIPPENLSKIFDPFFTTKPLGVGTGLGLSIAHRIVSEFGGEIVVRSKFGAGTTVSLILQEAPRHSEAPRRPSTLPPPSGRKRNLRILIVDDEPAILRALQRLLSSHEVFRAASGREAVERVEQIGPFDVIFCDVMMPELSGPDVYRRVSELKPGQEQKIVFVTGGAFADQTAKFLESIPNPKLSKPFEPGVVRELIKSLSA
jgi:PAS domain S-box-containing protein